MKWTRFVPKSWHLLGIASVAVVGVAFAQNQNNTQQTQPKNANNNQQKTTDAATTDRNTSNNQQDRNAQQGRQQVVGLGAQFQGQGKQGITVTTIEENGALAKSGLKQNDKIISMDGLSFNSPRQIEAYLWSHTGRPIPVVVDRGGQQSTVEVTIPQPMTRGGWLGIYLDQGEENIQGARISQIYPSGPAARANLQPGDVIKSIDTHPIAGAADAVMVIRELQPNSEVVFTIMRGTEEEKVNVTVGGRGNTAYQSFYNNTQQPGNFQQGQFQGQQQGQPGNNQFNGIPPHAMQLENDRRNAEQHERIEDEIRQPPDEIKKLRELLEKK